MPLGEGFKEERAIKPGIGRYILIVSLWGRGHPRCRHTQTLGTPSSPMWQESDMTTCSPPLTLQLLDS